jgi:hypothetical protein
VIELAPDAMNGVAEAEFFLAFRSLAAVRAVVAESLYPTAARWSAVE